MSLSRIKGILIQEYYITKRSLEVPIDLFYFAIINILVFGLFSNFLVTERNALSGQYLLLGTVLWEIVRVTQYTISVEILWNIWSRNLSNMFISPLSVTEYMIAVILSGAIKSFIIFIIVSSIAFFVFDFNILRIGITNIALSFINLSIFA